MIEKELRAELIDIKQKHEAQDKKIDRILFYLDNDTGTGEPGLVAQVKAHGKAFSDFKVQYAIAEAVQLEKAKRKGALNGFFTGMITTVVGNVIAFIFHTK